MNTNLQICTIKNITWLTTWVKQFCPGKTLRQAGIKKRSGIAAGWLLQLLLVLPFPIYASINYSGPQMACRIEARFMIFWLKQLTTGEF